MTAKQVRVTLVKSMNGRLKAHKACLTGLGLKRMQQSRVLEDTPAVRGMINRVYYMVKIEDV